MRKLTFEAIFLFDTTQMIRPVSCSMKFRLCGRQQAPFAGHLSHHGRFYILKHFLQKASTILPNVDGNRGAIVFSHASQVFHEKSIISTYFNMMIQYHDPFTVHFYGSQYKGKASVLFLVLVKSLVITTRCN